MGSLYSDSQTSLSDHSSWAVLSNNHLVTPLSPREAGPLHNRRRSEFEIPDVPQDSDDRKSVDDSDHEVPLDQDPQSLQAMIRNVAYRQFDSLLRGLMNLPPVPSEVTCFRSHLQDGKLKPTPESLESLRHWKSFGDYLRFAEDPISTLQLQDIRVTRRRLVAMLDAAGPFLPLERIIFCGNSIGLDPGCMEAMVDLALRIPSLVALSIHCNSLTDDHASHLQRLVEKHPALTSLSLVQNGLGESTVHVLCRTLLRKANSSMEAVDAKAPAVLGALNFSSNLISKDGISECATLRRRLLTLGFECTVNTANQRSFPSRANKLPHRK